MKNVNAQQTNENHYCVAQGIQLTFQLLDLSRQICITYFLYARHSFKTLDICF